MTTPKSVRVAVTQHEPAWLDLDAGVDATCKLIGEAAAGGAQLIAFPELWIPGYPLWIWTRPVDFELGTRYVQSSLPLRSAQMDRIRAAAAEHAVEVVLGFSERDGDSVYIAQAVVGADGSLRVARRKMKPTHMERTVFGDGGGECLANVADTPAAGRVGCLACWEHIQPLLKYHTLAQHEQIHVAAWPVLDDFVDGSPGFWSMSTEGCASLSQAYAVESGTFVLHATTALTGAGVQLMGTAGSPLMGGDSQGSSAVFGPDGRRLTPTGGARGKLLFADLDMSLITRAKTFADAAGHYSRPDMLWLGADPTRKAVVR